MDHDLILKGGHVIDPSQDLNGIADVAFRDGKVAYLSRYTHRVAISNRRIIKADANDVTFRYCKAPLGWATF